MKDPVNTREEFYKCGIASTIAGDDRVAGYSAA